ncbi:unnamed protein product [Knipowitschia caucasica]|uniref:Glypican 5 n=1 Tax=Knipowitschia caucasica TaxID=637954 RepID=A0AAV2LNW3_KNICA
MDVLWTYCFFALACFCGSVFGDANKCEEVRKVFLLRQIGPSQLLPQSPRTGSDLQVCTSKNLTCCTKKMEERYQLAAKRDIQNLLQMSSSSLKFLISRNVAAFQEIFEQLMKQAENHTVSVLKESFGNMADHSMEPVQELFTDIGLYLLGSEVSVDDMVQRFFDSLFPFVYNDLIHPGLSDTSPAYAECVRGARRDVRPFGQAPHILIDQISRSGTAGKLLLQALHLGIEVINTTDHLQLSRECRRALLKMHYCPHCQGLTESKPCMGYCLNVMRGCLASLAEIDVHWRDFVRSLEGLSSRMHGPQDLEQVLLGVHTLLHDAIGNALRNGPRITTQLHRVCGSVDRRLQSVSAAKEPLPLKSSPKGDALAQRRKDFLSGLRLFRTYYGGLADQLCVSDLSRSEGTSCWNGTNTVHSYTLRVVGSGIKAQSSNPEVKVKEADPVVSQIIDKLKHINQLLQGKSIPKLGTLDQIETGSGDLEGRYSGDCDDEDGCGGSGGDEVKRKVSRVSKLSPDVSRDHDPHHGPHHHPPSAKESSSPALTWAIWVLLLPCLHTLLAL